MNQFDKLPEKRILEKDVESYLVRKCRAEGWMCEKFTSPNRRAVPDRMVSTSLRQVFFVECKAPGKKPTDAQKRDHERRGNLGHVVTIVDSKESADKFISKTKDWLEALRGMLR